MPGDEHARQTPRSLLEGMAKGLAVMAFGLGSIAGAVGVAYADADPWFVLAIGAIITLAGFSIAIRLRKEVVRYA